MLSAQSGAVQSSDVYKRQEIHVVADGLPQKRFFHFKNHILSKTSKEAKQLQICIVSFIAVQNSSGDFNFNTFIDRRCYLPPSCPDIIKSHFLAAKVFCKNHCNCVHYTTIYLCSAQVAAWPQGAIVPIYDKMPKGLLCKSLVHAVRLLYHNMDEKLRRFPEYLS